MSFDSVKTKDIGVGSRATLMAVGGTSDTNTGISAGQLLINGVLVGASSATDDYATQSEKSAIAKVAAINRVAAQSGVYAKTEANIVAGKAMAVTGAATGTITINGVATDSITTASDNSLTRKLIVNAINAKSAASGVTAIDTGDDTLGITLNAADGRDITVAFSANLNTTETGVRSGTETASYSLYTLDGRDITIDTATGVTTAIANSGLSIGTFKSNQTYFTSYTRNGTNGIAGNGTAVPATTASPGLLDNASLIINGVAVGASLTTDDTSSDTTASGSTRAASAIAIAAAINRVSSQTGVIATAAANVIRGQNFTAGTAPGTLFLNGSTIAINSTTRNGVIDSINNYSGKTGVVASAFGEALQLVAADGRNIELGAVSGTNSNFGLGNVTIGTVPATNASATTYYSQVTLNSSNKFTIQAGKTGNTNLEYLGFRTGTFGGSDNGLKVNQVDVSTQLGANQALTAIDAAIETVSRAQAKSGALNNRLDVIINNLTEASTNIQASRSRITDADYAVETANLAKQQIISQAATAMLAQANQQSQSVLSLLK